MSIYSFVKIIPLLYTVAGMCLCLYLIQIFSEKSEISERKESAKRVIKNMLTNHDQSILNLTYLPKAEKQTCPHSLEEINLGEFSGVMEGCEINGEFVADLTQCNDLAKKKKKKKSYFDKRIKLTIWDQTKICASFDKELLFRDDCDQAKLFQLAPGVCADNQTSQYNEPFNDIQCENSPSHDFEDKKPAGKHAHVLNTKSLQHHHDSDSLNSVHLTNSIHDLVKNSSQLFGCEFSFKSEMSRIVGLISGIKFAYGPNISICLDHHRFPSMTSSNRSDQQNNQQEQRFQMQRQEGCGEFGLLNQSYIIPLVSTSKSLYDVYLENRVIEKIQKEWPGFKHDFQGSDMSVWLVAVRQILIRNIDICRNLQMQHIDDYLTEIEQSKTKIVQICTILVMGFGVVLTICIPNLIFKKKFQYRLLQCAIQWITALCAFIATIYLYSTSYSDIKQATSYFDEVVKSDCFPDVQGVNLAISAFNEQNPQVINSKNELIFIVQIALAIVFFILQVYQLAYIVDWIKFREPVEFTVKEVKIIPPTKVVLNQEVKRKVEELKKDKIGFKNIVGKLAAKKQIPSNKNESSQAKRPSLKDIPSSDFQLQQVNKQIPKVQTEEEIIEIERDKDKEKKETQENLSLVTNVLESITTATVYEVQDYNKIEANPDLNKREDREHILFSSFSTQFKRAKVNLFYSEEISNELGNNNNLSLLTFSLGTEESLIRQIKLESENKEAYENIVNDESKREKFLDSMKLKIAQAHGVDPNSITINELKKGSIEVQYQISKVTAQGILQRIENNITAEETLTRFIREDRSLAQFNVEGLRYNKVLTTFAFTKKDMDSKHDKNWNSSFYGKLVNRGIIPSTGQPFQYMYPKGFEGYGLNIRQFTQKDGNMNWIKKGHEDEWLILYTFIGFNSQDEKNIRKTSYENRPCLLNPQVLINEGVILFDNPYDAELYFEQNNQHGVEIAPNVKVFTLLQVRIKPSALKKAESKIQDPEYNLYQRGENNQNFAAAQPQITYDIYIVNSAEDIRPYRILIKNLYDVAPCDLNSLQIEKLQLLQQDELAREEPSMTEVPGDLEGIGAFLKKQPQPDNEHQLKLTFQRVGLSFYGNSKFYEYITHSKEILVLALSSYYTVNNKGQKSDFHFNQEQKQYYVAFESEYDGLNPEAVHFIQEFDFIYKVEYKLRYKNDKNIDLKRDDLYLIPYCFLPLMPKDKNTIEVILENGTRKSIPREYYIAQKLEAVNNLLVSGPGSNDLKIQVAFVMDATESMKKYIKQTQEMMTQIMQTFIDRFRQRKDLEIEFAVVKYTDHQRPDDRNPESDAQVVELRDFHNVQNINALMEFVGNIKESGGGDLPEAMLDGIQDGLEKLEWEPVDSNKAVIKIMIVLADSPPHGIQFNKPDSGDDYPEGCCPEKNEESIKALLKQHSIRFINVNIDNGENMMDIMNERFQQQFYQGPDTYSLIIAKAEELRKKVEAVIHKFIP